MKTFAMSPFQSWLLIGSMMWLIWEFVKRYTD
jgi:hypothetical protein